MKKLKNTINSNSRGQALVTLLFFMIVAITITSAAIILIFINSMSAVSMDESREAYLIAESGIENALINIIRNPAYTFENLSIDGGNAIINVASASGTFTITSKGSIGKHIRTLQTTASDDAEGNLRVNTWKEIYP